jgi:chromosome segregation ATPase
MAERSEMEELLAQLDAEERTISRRRAQLHERIALYPDTTGVLDQKEREISRQRRELHARIDALRAALSAMRDEQARAEGR